MIRPSTNTGVIPWWTINGRPDEEKAIAQLDDFQAKGFNEFFLYPNFGMEVEFLSEEWFSFIAFVLEQCRRRGMGLWFYDELNWPSGFAGGRFCREFPQYKMRTLRSRRLTLQPGDRWQPVSDREFVWAGVFDLAGNAPREISTSQDYVNTTDQPLQLLAIENWLVDDYFLCAMGTYGTRNESGCLDALNPDAVRAWMSLAYWPYADRFPEDMGKTIRGFFFDEPTMVSAFHTEDVPWTAGLEESFRQRYGYDCRPLLWTLFTQTDGHEQFRYDYWRLVTYLFETSFTGQLSDWCQEHGVILSGHCWPEEPSCQRLMTNSTGDTFSLQRHLQMPGTDFLYCENNYAEKAGMCQDTPGWARNLIYSAKLPSSTARYVNVSQTICESSGASALDPGCTAPAATKKTYDFLYAMGITTMNPAFPLDRTDIRKYVCMLDAGQPYWRHYKLVTDYLNRLGQFNSRGRTDTRIAVLSPLSTRFAFSEITDDTSIRSEKTPLNRKGDCVEPVLATLDALVRAHLDFELLFEDVVLDSPVATSGELLAPNSNFQVIVLPQCYALDDAVWTKLDEFARAGGHLVAVGASPTLPLKHGPQALEVAPLPTVQLNPADADFASQLVSSLKAMSSPAYELQGAHNEEILAQARQDGEWQGIFLANGTPGPKTFTVVGKLAEKLRTLVDPQGDKQEPWTQGQTITLLDNQSCLLVTTSADAPQTARNTARPATLLELPKDGWQVQGNVRNCQRMQLEVLHDGKFVEIDDTGIAPFDLDPDVLEDVQLRASFDVNGAVPEDLRVWLDNADFTSLTVNDTAVTQQQHERLLDSANVTVTIAPYCHVGRNVLTLTVKLSKWLKASYGIRIHFTTLLQGLTPPLLFGNFSASDGHIVSPCPAQISCGPLEPQGFPQFCDELSVARHFDLDRPEEAASLAIGESLYPIEAILNGQNLGVRLWQNGSLPIPPGLLKKQDNVLVLNLCGDIWNTFGRRWLGKPVEHNPFLLPDISIVSDGGLFQGV